MLGLISFLWIYKGDIFLSICTFNCYSASSCAGTHVIPMVLRNHSNNRFCPVIHISPSLLKIITANPLNFQIFTKSESKRLINWLTLSVKDWQLFIMCLSEAPLLWILILLQWNKVRSKILLNRAWNIVTYNINILLLSIRTKCVFKILWYIDYDCMIRDFGDLCKKTKSFIENTYTSGINRPIIIAPHHEMSRIYRTKNTLFLPE